MGFFSIKLYNISAVGGANLSPQLAGIFWFGKILSDWL
jgi:hypothetical protein